jgi:hypothetical protein
MRESSVKRLKISKWPLAAVSFFLAGTLLATSTNAEDLSPRIPVTPIEGHTNWQSMLDSGMWQRSVFASEYVSVGAGAGLQGNVLAGTYLTTGVSADLDGSTAAGTDTTMGADSVVLGSIQSGASIEMGEGATTTGEQKIPNTTEAIESARGDGRQDLLSAQGFLGKFAATTFLEPGNVDTDTTFTPGVYRVSGLLTFTAGITITLDAQNSASEFVFNVSNYITFGEGVKVEVINANVIDKKPISVTWNATGGYVSVGAGASIVGTILANGYVSTGAGSTLTGVNVDCGGVAFAATSYVSIGADATVGTGTESCSPSPGTVLRS